MIEITPLVSIVIPVFNVEEYLSQCVESATNQTLKKIEIILVDDGSTDSSGKMCDKFSKTDNRIRVIHKKNGGLSDARNVGREAAEGKYIYFLDSDDWIENYAIEALYHFAEENSLDMVLFDSRVVDKNGTDYLDIQHYMRYYRIGNYNGVMTGKELFGRMIENKEHYSCVPLLFIKRLAISTKFEDILHEDELFTIRMLYAMERVAYYPEMLYVRRIRQGSIMTVGKTPKHFWGMTTVIDELLKIKNTDNYVLRYVCTLLQHSEIIYRQLNVVDRKKVKQRRNDLIENFKNSDFFGYKRLERITKLLFLYPLYDSVFNTQNSFISRILQRVTQYRKENRLLKTLKFSSKQRIWILGVPTHGNLGDHAIAIAQNKMLRRLFPETEIIEIDRATYVHQKKSLSRKISAQDILVIPGGGWLGNQWYHNEIMVEDVCNRFRKNKIVILPQTVFFKDNAEKNNQIIKARNVFSYAKNTLFLVRDKNSFEFTNKNYDINSFLVPDMVLQLSANFNLKRSGVLICFRNDCESVIEKKTRTEFISWIKDTFRAAAQPAVAFYLPVAKFEQLLYNF